jgi:PAS domain S-box-containing protein
MSEKARRLPKNPGSPEKSGIPTAASGGGAAGRSPKQKRPHWDRELVELASLYETAPVALAFLNSDLRYVHLNEQFARWNGAAAGEHIGKRPREVAPEIGAAIEPLLEEALRTGRPVADREIQHRESIFLVGCYPVSMKTLSGVTAMVRDITGRRRAGEDLASSRRELAQELAQVGVWDWDIRTNRIVWSAGEEQLFGVAGGAFDGTYEGFFRFVHPDDRAALAEIIARTLREGVELDTEFRIVRPDGSVRWLAGRGRTLYDSNGQPTRMLGINMDITERKRAEQQVQQSLKEKETLLREIHHRVKNNLQIIASLLNLQSRYIKDPEARRLTKESQSRIRSMALIHNMLYQSKDLASVEFSSYLRKLTQQLSESQAPGSASRFRIDAEPLELNIETAVPCALIVNELVSNALEHAFPDGAPGEIRIELRSAPGGQIILRVADNGIGFPKAFDFQSPQSFGLQLVMTLVEQLNGAIELDGGQGGSCIEVRFSELQYSPRT